MKIKELKTKIKSKYYLKKDNIYWNKILGPTSFKNEATIFSSLNEVKNFLKKTPNNLIEKYYFKCLRIVEIDE